MGKQYVSALTLVLFILFIYCVLIEFIFHVSLA